MRRRFCCTFGMLIAVMIMPVMARAGISIEGGLTHDKVALTGEAYQGVVTIKNQGDTPQELKVYQTDYRFTHEGAIIYGDPGKDARSNAHWVTFSPSRITIPPREKAVINYTVSVPKDETLVGTYWSMLMIEGLPESAPEASGKEKNKNIALGITQIMRYAIQVVTNIGDTGTKKLTFLQAKIVKEQGARILQIDVQNDGERLLRPQLWTEIHTATGDSLGRFQGEQYRIYPGTSKRFRIDITAAPTGTHKALVVADCGEDDLFGISYTLKFEH
jgi:hypothetical protein